MTEEARATLATDVAQLIIERLNVTHVEAKQVNSSTPLFSPDNELALDSIDAIEIVMALQQVYGVRITDQQPAREILNSIDTIVDYLIKENATKPV